MITFSDVKKKIGETHKEQTRGFRYGVITFYSLFTEAVLGFMQQLGNMENLDGITRKDRHALINWIQTDVQKPILVKLGFAQDEVDEDIFEAKIIMSGQEVTNQ